MEINTDFMAGLGEYNRTIWWNLGIIHFNDTSSNLFPCYSWLECSKNWLTEWHPPYMPNGIRVCLFNTCRLFAEKEGLQSYNNSEIGWRNGHIVKWSFCARIGILWMQFNRSYCVCHDCIINAWRCFIWSVGQSNRYEVN